MLCTDIVFNNRMYFTCVFSHFNKVSIFCSYSVSSQLTVLAIEYCFIIFIDSWQESITFIAKLCSIFPLSIKVILQHLITDYGRIIKQALNIFNFSEYSKTSQREKPFLTFLILRQREPSPSFLSN